MLFKGGQVIAKSNATGVILFCLDENANNVVARLAGKDFIKLSVNLVNLSQETLVELLLHGLINESNADNDSGVVRRPSIPQDVTCPP